MSLLTREEARELFEAELKDLPAVIQCRFCGEDKQLVQPNKRIAFWVHLDLEIFEKCKTLTFRTTFLKDLAALWSHWNKIKGKELEEKRSERSPD